MKFLVQKVEGYEGKGGTGRDHRLEGPCSLNLIDALNSVHHVFEISLEVSWKFVESPLQIFHPVSIGQAPQQRPHDKPYPHEL